VTVTRQRTPLDPHKKGESSLDVISIAFVADAGDASVPATTIEGVRGRLVRLVTNPGVPAPSDNYDFVLNDADGFDVLDGAGTNRDQSNTEEVPLSMATGEPRPVDGGDLSFVLTGNAVNSAQGVVKLYVLQA
jgi:hypothetical protein